MKHIYMTDFSITGIAALGMAVRGTKQILILLLLGVFLLISGDGYAQTGKTFIASQLQNGNNANNNWTNPEVWGFNNTAPEVGVSYPGPNDNVIIQKSAAVVVNSAVACRSLQLDPKTGSGTPGLTIASEGNLTVNNLEILVDNNGTNAKAALRIIGRLIINGAVTIGMGKFDFICETGSTVEYKSTTSLIAPQSVNSNQDQTIYGNYYNLIINGSAQTSGITVTMPRNVTVEGTLSLLNSGKLNTGTNATTSTPYILTLGETASINPKESTNAYITGRVQSTRSIESGIPNAFGNMGFTAMHTTGAARSVTVARTTGTPLVFTETVNGVSTTKTSARRYFEVSNPVTNGPTANISGLNLSFDFLAHERGVENYGLYRNAATAGAYTFITDDNIPVNTFGAAGQTLPGTYSIFPYTSPMPLPVELVSFKAQRHEQGVQLKWMTASEQDNSGFEVQVSTDASAFQKIGFVKSEVGTTSIAQRYSFLDIKAVAGTRYYRLAQIDLDGTTTYSSVQAVTLSGGNGEVSAYPNPFQDRITVKLNATEAQTVKTILANAHARVVLRQEETVTGNTITIDTSHITAKGIYILHVMESDGTKHTFKLMKR